MASSYMKCCKCGITAQERMHRFVVPSGPMAFEQAKAWALYCFPAAAADWESTAKLRALAANSSLALCDRHFPLSAFDEDGNLEPLAVPKGTPPLQVNPQFQLAFESPPGEPGDESSKIPSPGMKSPPRDLRDDDEEEEDEGRPHARGRFAHQTRKSAMIRKRLLRAVPPDPPTALRLPVSIHQKDLPPQVRSACEKLIQDDKLSIECFIPAPPVLLTENNIKDMSVQLQLSTSIRDLVAEENCSANVDPSRGPSLELNETQEKPDETVTRKTKVRRLVYVRITLRIENPENPDTVDVLHYYARLLRYGTCVAFGEDELDLDAEERTPQKIFKRKKPPVEDVDPPQYFDPPTEDVVLSTEDVDMSTENVTISIEIIDLQAPNSSEMTPISNVRLVEGECAKCGASSQDPLVTMHPFPKLTKITKENVDRLRFWAACCYPDVDWLSRENLQKLMAMNPMMCGRHFSDSAFDPRDKTKLRTGALPINDSDT